jgi:hypothetical protein
MSVFSYTPSLPEIPDKPVLPQATPPTLSPAVQSAKHTAETAKAYLQEHVTEFRRELFIKEMDSRLQQARHDYSALLQSLETVSPEQRRDLEDLCKKCKESIDELEQSKRGLLLDQFNERLRSVYDRYFDDYDIKRLAGSTWDFTSFAYLDDLIDSLDTAAETERPKIERAIDQLKFADQIHRDIGATTPQGALPNRATVEAGLQTAIASIRQKITSLPTGESLILYGGSIDHAILYEVRRTDKETFSFSILNTGDSCKGLDIVEGSPRVRNYTLENIPLEDIDNPNFWHDLLGYNYLSDPVRQRSVVGRFIHWTFGSMPEIYKTANSYLLGKSRVHPDIPGGHKQPKLQRLHYRAQTHGTCACRCLDTWIARELGEATYERFYTSSLKKQAAKLKGDEALFGPQPSLSFWQKLIQNLVSKRQLNVTSSEYKKITTLVKRKLSETPSYPIFEKPGPKKRGAVGRILWYILTH